MKRDMTYGQLMKLEKEIANSPVLLEVCVNKNKMRRFLQDTAVRLETAKNKVASLIRKHVVCNDHNEPTSILKADGSSEYVWCRPGSKKEYEKECMEFLELTFTVTV